MLRLRAASGEELLALDAKSFENMVKEDGSSILSLKRHVARKHFLQKYSRFQLRILREGDPSELLDEEEVALPMDLQLILMGSFMPLEEKRDRRFMESCAHSDVAAVEKALRELQDPNVCQGVTALVGAAGEGYVHVVRLLLEAKADTEWQDEENGMTALHYAVEAGHFNVVRHLLEVGADKEAATIEGSRALHLASLEGEVEVVRLLLDAGADKECKDLCGLRPLHAAARGGHIEVIDLLLKYGVEKTPLDNNGHRPLEVARIHGMASAVHGIL